MLVIRGTAFLQPLPGLGDERAPEDEAAREREEHDHDRPAYELGRRELPAHQYDQDDTQLDDEVRRGEHEHHRRDEVGALLEE